MQTIVNGLVVTPGGVVEGGVAIEDGVIVAVGHGRHLPIGDQVFDAKGRWILPGVVDPEAHLGSNNGLDEDFRTESRAAIAMGVTTWGLQQTSHTIFDAASGRPAPDAELTFSSLAAEFVAIGEANSYTDFFLTPLLMSAVQAGEIGQLAEEWGITTYKLYMHMRLGREQLLEAWPQAPLLGVRSFDDSLPFTAMREIAKLGTSGLISLHCENWEIARVLEGELRAAGRRDLGAWHDRSPGYLEAMHVRMYGYLAGKLGCRFHVQHVSAPETITEIAKLRDDGVDIYGQTGAHYLVLPESAWKLNVPLRPDSWHERLWEALRIGLVSTVGSDHVCRRMTREQMDTGNVWTSISGFPSRVEAHLPLMMTHGVNGRRLSIERLCQVLSSNPARLWGVYPQKGALQVGSDGDVVVVDPTAKVHLTRDRILGAAGWSLYEGMDFTGWPIATFARGDLVAEWAGDRCEISDSRRGSYLRRSVDAADWRLRIR